MVHEPDVIPDAVLTETMPGTGAMPGTGIAELSKLFSQPDVLVLASSAEGVP